MFHRLRIPTYFGGLPGGYDYINNALVGTPAMADGARASGPNQGTYFVAFGDDATSANANRPSRALAENCDHIDDLLRRDLALPVRTAVAAGPVSTIALPAATYLGAPGTPATPEGLNTVFEITDEDDNELLDSQGRRLGAAGIILQLPDAFGSGGFSEFPVRVSLSEAIPPGQRYRVYYATRTTLATLPADALSFIKIRGAQEIAAGVEDLFRRLQGGNLAWNAPWTSTVFDLARSGLDDRYRRATTAPVGRFNTPGDGAVIVRDGPAPTSRSQTLGGRAYPDPYNAAWLSDQHDVGTDRATGSVGSAGFVALAPRWQVRGEGGANNPTPAVFGFAALAPHEERPVSVVPAAGNGYWTRLPPGTPASLTEIVPGLYTAVLQVAPGDAYFWKRDGANRMRTAIVVRRDLMRVRFTTGEDIVCVVTRLLDANAQACALSPLDGGSLPITLFPAQATLTWISHAFSVGLGAAGAKETFDAQRLGGLNRFSFDGVYSVRSPIAVDPVTSMADFVAYGRYAPGRFGELGRRSFKMLEDPHAYFGAGDAGSATPVLGWGGFDDTFVDGQTGARFQNAGQLLADGSGIFQTVVANRVARDSVQRFPVQGANQNIVLDVERFDTFELFAPFGGASIASLAFADLEQGNSFRIIVHQLLQPLPTPAGPATWPNNTMFESPADAWFSGVGGMIDLYTVTFVGTSGGADPIRRLVSVRRFS